MQKNTYCVTALRLFNFARQILPIRLNYFDAVISTLRLQQQKQSHCVLPVHIMVHKVDLSVDWWISGLWYSFKWITIKIHCKWLYTQIVFCYSTKEQNKMKIFYWIVLEFFMQLTNEKNICLCKLIHSLDILSIYYFTKC